MIRKVIKNICLVLSVIFASFSITIAFVPLLSEEDFFSGDGSSEVINYNNIYDDIDKRYPDAKIVEITEKYIPATNLKQSMLNECYNNKHSTNYGGTCGEVAVATIMLNYLNKTRKMQITDSNKFAIFESVMNLALKNDYYPFKNNNSTKSKNVVKILNKALTSQHINKKGTEKFGSLYDKAKAISDRGELAILGISNHFMVTAGYYEVKVETTEKTGWIFKKTETVIKTIKYFVVLDGWRNGNTLGDVTYYSDKLQTYSFFPEDKIGKNIITDFLQQNSYFLIEIK